MVQLELMRIRQGIRTLCAFNSIMVQLEHASAQNVRLEHYTFNSIMVQLEHSATLTLRAATIFQFHYGSIRTLPRLKKNSVNFTFNSIMVQLELLVCDLVRKRQLPFNSIMVQLELVEALSLALFTTASFNSIMVQLER